LNIASFCNLVVIRHAIRRKF